MSGSCLKCKNTLVQGFDENEEKFITNKICPDCKSDIQCNQGPTKISELLDFFELPVIAINKDRQVIAANTHALNLTNKSLDESLFMLGGDFMNCKHSILSEGCGNTDHCITCAVSHCIAMTHETGIGFNKIKTHLHTRDGEIEKKLKITITTELQNDIALLRIDEIINYQ